jgi:hypothetical protein
MSQHEQESNTTTPISGEPEAITGKARNGKSEVGYRRPSLRPGPFLCDFLKTLFVGHLLQQRSP